MKKPLADAMNKLANEVANEEYRAQNFREIIGIVVKLCDEAKQNSAAPDVVVFASKVRKTIMRALTLTGEEDAGRSDKP